VRLDEIFNDLALLNDTSEHFKIPIMAIKKDIVLFRVLTNLLHCDQQPNVYFKGGTSISKSYPKVLNRFSEDIDLTLIVSQSHSVKAIEKTMKSLESHLAIGLNFMPIPEERSSLGKSSWVYFGDTASRTKLEIGITHQQPMSSIHRMKTYVQEFLEFKHQVKKINPLQLHAIQIQTVDIRQTFVEKLLAIRRHALLGTLVFKVRHLYDVVRLSQIESIQTLLLDRTNFKALFKRIQAQDEIYYVKRHQTPLITIDSGYQLSLWQDRLTRTVQQNYERLHLDLLFTNQKQDFSDVIKTLQRIQDLLD
jgi:predicted nucleotidyltransferase component of viral defense system